MRRLTAAVLALSAGCAAPKYVAKVNHETITGKELRLEFARHHMALENVLSDEADIRKYVDRLVDRRLFVQEGYRMGLQDTPDVRESVARVRGQKLIELFRQEEIEARAKVTDEELKALYATITENVLIRQVVVESRAQAEEVAAAVAKGADLEKLARERSVADTSKQGGLLIVGWGVDEAYEKVLFPLPDGAVSPPFRSQAGWEVARVEQHKPIDPRPAFDAVAPKLRPVLQKRKRAAREEEVYSGLWSKYDAKLAACVPDLEALKAAAAAKDQTPCATWRGGQVTAEALAGRVKLDQLAQLGARWPDLKKLLVEDLVNRELVVLEADARGYGARPEVADKVAVLQDDLVESRLYRDYVVKGVTASDDDARRFYDANPDRFTAEAQYELAQVLVSSKDEADEVARKVATRQPFAELAAAYSVDKRNSADGGRVGFVAKSQLKDAFAPVVALGEGEVSAPLQAPDGWHVVKVLSLRPERKLAWDEAKEKARAAALEEKQKAEVDRWVAKLRAAATIEVSRRGIRAYGEQVRAEQRRASEAKAAEKAAKAAAAADAPAPQAPAAPGAAPTATEAPASPAAELPAPAAGAAAGR